MLCLVAHSLLSDSLQPDGLQPTRRLCLWGSPCRNIGVDFHALLQGIFPTQGLNQGLLHCRWILYKLSYLGSPVPPKKDQKWDSKDWTVTSNKNTTQGTVQEYLQEYRNYSWLSYYWWKDGWNGLNFKQSLFQRKEYSQEERPSFKISGSVQHQSGYINSSIKVK